jgi:hypothetical protein
MDLVIEIRAERVSCKQDGKEALSAPLVPFLGALVEQAEGKYLSEAIPEGVRFIRGRGEATVLALEEPPAVRTVRWLSERSPAPYGTRALYQTARLAFPFVVLVVAFRAGALTGYQRCFYRVAPLEKVTDTLLLPNLLNVASGHGQPCWLCLASLTENLACLPWSEKVRVLWNHVFGAAFNRSAEVHEGSSYWGAMRSIDPRHTSLAAWEEASRKDPYFMLGVRWRPLGQTIGEVMDGMLAAVAPSSPLPQTAAGLVPILGQLAAARSRAPAGGRK